MPQETQGASSEGQSPANAYRRDSAALVLGGASGLTLGVGMAGYFWAPADFSSASFLFGVFTGLMGLSVFRRECPESLLSYCLGVLVGLFLGLPAAFLFQDGLGARVPSYCYQL